ncbi:MAG TPA: peptide ABC transporter substrate-binding protein [Anaerolineales bacterium]|nr:peptide ABC transporter substrate-binding protein [Anaerolineales bacterium]
MKRNLYLLLSLVVLASMILAACGGAAPATEEPPAITEPAEGEATEPAATEPSAATEAPASEASGTVTITFTQEPDNLNPLYTQMFFSGILREFWLKPAWTFDVEAQPVPVLVTEIPSTENGGLSEDGTTVTINLRDDITWSDGEPLTSEDFVFTYDMIMSEQNVVQSRYPYEDYVASVEAPDATTVVVTFNEPFAAWLTTLFYFVLPKHILQPVFDSEGTIDNAEWNRAPTVGVGPFVFNEWETGSHISFVANPNWIQPPKVEQVFIRIVPDDAAQEAAIIAGDTDIGVFLSSDQIPTLEAGGDVDVVAVASGYSEGWFLNVNPETAHPAMLDVNVRKALAFATDRFTIVGDLLDDSVNPVNANFWDNNPPYGNTDIEPYPYDPDEAQRLLDEAGWVDSNGDGTRDKDGVELVLRYITNDRELRQNVQAVVQQQWSLVGIGAELVNYSSDVYWNGYNDNGPQAQGLYDIAEYSSVSTSFPDPESSDNWLCDSISSADNPDGANWQGYCDPEMDELLMQQATTLDTEERIEIYKQIQQKMYDEAIYIGMWKDPDLWSINDRVSNVQLAGVYPFWNAHEWEVSE